MEEDITIKYKEKKGRSFQYFIIYKPLLGQEEERKKAELCE
jgi:hypothetical protein